ncbi:MAG: hydroxyethylthiazole kinase [Halalkalicoccus sp.]
MTLPTEIGLFEACESVTATKPLVNAVTNAVTMNDVANLTLHWGGLPVMSDDRREVGEMVSTADACLLNMGDVSEEGERTMLAAGRAATEAGIPLVLDPVGVGATEIRTSVGARLRAELDVTIVNGNYAEISALAGERANVRGVEAVGEYDGIATAARTLARETESVVVASGETDVIADEAGAVEVSVGHPMLGRVVGTGCMLGATLATFAAGGGDAFSAALSGTLAFGLAAERAAAGEYGEFHGPASYKTAFLDSVADFDGSSTPDIEARLASETDG